MATQKIAIIGSGASGLGAAWALHKSGMDFTLYEASERIGGQALTIPFPTRQGYVPIDMGVIITNAWTYPNLYQVFEQLNVHTIPFALEVGASFGPKDAWVAGRPEVGMMWNRMAPEASRFELDMFRIMNLPPESPERFVPLRTHVEGRYSSDFVHHVLQPMLAVLAVAQTGLLDEPLIHVAELTQYLSFVAPTTWRILRGGTAAYMAPLVAGFFDRIRLGTRIIGVARGAKGVTLTTERAQREPYDAVVIATDAPEALKMLVDPTPLETELLSAFTYVPSVTYLHADIGVLSRYLPTDINTQYVSFSKDAQPDLQGALTFNSGAVLGLNTPALVTTSSADAKYRPPRHIVAKQYWPHLLMTPRGRIARKMLHQIQGVQRTWFCGTHTTFLSHEAAFVSGLVIANKLGAAYPYAGKPLAEDNFNVFASVMFPERKGEQRDRPPVSAPRR